VIFGEGQDDDVVGGYGMMDLGGTGQDGILETTVSSTQPEQR